jgi:uncharacterized protein with von Willebrand factor type A (vWA) domain
MEAMSDDLIGHGDIQRALRRLAQRGFQTPDGRNMDGLRQLLDRLRQRRQEHLDRYNLNSVMDGIRERLKEIQDLETSTLAQRLEEARQAQQQRGDDDSNAAAAQQPRPSQQGDPQQQQGGARSTEEELAEFLKNLEEELDRAREQRAQQQQAQGGQQQQNSGQEDQDGGQEAGQESGQQQGNRQAGQQQSGGRSGQRGRMDPSTARTLEGMAQRKMEFMESLPEDPGGVIKALNDYDFMDEEARQKFQELMEELRQQAMQSYTRNMMQQMQNITPEQMAAVKQMLRDLNQMLRDRMQGREPNFQEFMQKWGPMFGDNPPQDLDELMERLQSQMAQMQSLLDSLPEDLRKELMDSMQAALNDPELQQELAQMAAMMDALMPMDDMRQDYPFAGEESLSLQEAMRLMEELQKIDDMEAQLRGAERRGEMEDIDVDQLRDLLGDEAAQNLEWLRRLQEELEKAGYIRKNGNKLELTPKGIRKIGEKALKDIFNKLKQDRLGAHDLHKAGLFGEKNEDDTKVYEFGDPFNLHMTRTIKNAVKRQGAGTPIRLQPDDFEIFRDEQLTQASTVILLDQSRSMAISGSFEAAKRVALALHTLIKMQFPRDNLYVVGFADYAWELKEGDLVKATWGGYSPGTNMQHALMLSRQLLNKHRSGMRQVIMVTDGEPTAHLEGGAPYFTYPPSPRTLDMTLREVKRCTQEGIVINTFMLEMAYYLVNFVRQMTKLNRGRAFFTSPDKLGEYILVDYLNNKRSAIAS